MDTAQIFVTLGGVLLIALVLWFFFGPRTTTAASANREGVQEIEVIVRGGYQPDRIEVRQGQPVRLNFLRQEATPCTEQVILGDFGIARELPQGRRVAIEFTPENTGEFTFHCGMNMVRGQIVVRP